MGKHVVEFQCKPFLDLYKTHRYKAPCYGHVSNEPPACSKCFQMFMSHILLFLILTTAFRFLFYFTVFSITLWNGLNNFTSKDLVNEAVYHNWNNPTTPSNTIFAVDLFSATILSSDKQEPNTATAWVFPQRSPEWDLHFFLGSGMCPSSPCGERKTL